MQQITQDYLANKAKELLNSGICSRVFGWKRGEFDYDLTPAVFTNFSIYLVNETRRDGGKVAVFLKPCDSYSFNQLLTEHRFDREKVYAVGIPCEGMTDINKVRQAVDGIAKLTFDENGNIIVETLYDGTAKLDRNECMLERCIHCKSKRCVVYDELLGENGEVLDDSRFDEVKKLEAMTADERFAFWQGELSRCIRCNACRDACPACTCEKCVFDNPASGVENKAAADSFEEKMFHIIRAFHVAGRCTDCGECSRVCPQHIPLHLLNRKFIKDINAFYGEYQAGAEEGSRAPIVNYTKDDIEPSAAVERSGNNA